MSSRLTLGVVALLLAASMPSAASEESTDSIRPVAAIAVGLETSVVVAWVAGAEAPDFFRIYGIQNETLSFLTDAEPEAMSAEVQGGFREYAVTAVRNDVESEPAVAVVGADLICVTISPGIPPGIAIGCLSRLEIAVHFVVGS